MNLADVDLRLLRVFRTIVECRGLTAAQAKLNIGRSTISSHLSELETRLGFVLCKRGRGGFELTASGRATYAAAVELFDHCETFLANLRGTEHRYSGRIKLAVFDAALNEPKLKISEAIQALKSKSDAIHFELWVLPPDEVEVAVLNGTASLGITTERMTRQSLTFTELYVERSLLYCGTNHKLAALPQEERLAAVRGADTIRRGYRRGLEPFERHAASSSTAIAHSEEAVLHLIRSGKYVGFLPENFARDFERTGHIICLSSEQLQYATKVGIVQSKRGGEDPLVQEFSRLLQEL